MIALLVTSTLDLMTFPHEMDSDFIIIVKQITHQPFERAWWTNPSPWRGLCAHKMCIYVFFHVHRHGVAISFCLFYIWINHLVWHRYAGRIYTKSAQNCTSGDHTIHKYCTMDDVNRSIAFACVWRLERHTKSHLDRTLC